MMKVSRLMYQFPNRAQIVINHELDSKGKEKKRQTTNVVKDYIAKFNNLSFRDIKIKNDELESVSLDLRQ